MPKSKSVWDGPDRRELASGLQHRREESFYRYQICNRKFWHFPGRPDTGTAHRTFSSAQFGRSSIDFQPTLEPDMAQSFRQGIVSLRPLMSLHARLYLRKVANRPEPAAWTTVYHPVHRPTWFLPIPIGLEPQIL